MVDYSKGYSASYYAERVDPATWRDVGVIRLTGGTIKRETTGKRQSADLSCVNYRIPVEQWVRVYLDIRQGGETAHVPLFTGIAVSPDDDINGRLTLAGGLPLDRAARQPDHSNVAPCGRVHALGVIRGAVAF